MKNLKQIKSHRDAIHQLRDEIDEKHAQIEDLCTELTRLQTNPRFTFSDLVVWNNSDHPNHTRVGKIIMSRATPEGWEYDIQTHVLHWAQDQPRWITKVIKERDLHTAQGWTEKDLTPKKFRLFTRKKASSQEKTREPALSNEEQEENEKAWIQFLTEANNPYILNQ